MSSMFPNLQALAAGKIDSVTNDQYPFLRREAYFALGELNSARERIEILSKEAEVAKAMHQLVVAERDLERLQVDRLKKALASSCDEERSLAVSEGGGHGTCGLAGELEAKLKAAETTVDQLKAQVNLLRQTPKVVVICECQDDGIVGSTSLEVIRVERLDDGTLMAVTDHWPDRHERQIDDLVSIAARMREMLMQYRERARRVAPHPDLPQIDESQVNILLQDADQAIRSRIRSKIGSSAE